MSIRWNREEVIRLLSATVTDEPSESGGHTTIVRFADTKLRYELYLNGAGVFLAADPERPVQGLPYFEITLPCSEIAPVVRSAMPTGIGIYSGPIGTTSLRFSITRRTDGEISLSGAWDGLTAAVDREN